MDDDRFGVEQQPKKRKRPWWYLHWMPDPDDPDGQDQELHYIADFVPAILLMLFLFTLFAVIGFIAIAMANRHALEPAIAAVLGNPAAAALLGLAVCTITALYCMMGIYVALAFKHLRRLRNRIKHLESMVTRLSKHLEVDREADAN